MGVIRCKDYKKETKVAIKKYEEIFDTDFPTYHFEFGLDKFFPKATDFEEAIIDVIDECINKKKDVYELGYFSLEDDLIQY